MVHSRPRLSASAALGLGVLVSWYAPITHLALPEPSVCRGLGGYHAVLAALAPYCFSIRYVRRRYQTASLDNAPRLAHPDVSFRYLGNYLKLCSSRDPAIRPTMNSGAASVSARGEHTELVTTGIIYMHEMTFLSRNVDPSWLNESS